MNDQKLLNIGDKIRVLYNEERSRVFNAKWGDIATVIEETEDRGAIRYKCKLDCGLEWNVYNDKHTEWEIFYEDFFR